MRYTSRTIYEFTSGKLDHTTESVFITNVSWMLTSTIKTPLWSRLITLVYINIWLNVKDNI
jgi:hypothetical protein